jgi:hypothetical protein
LFIFFATLTPLQSAPAAVSIVREGCLTLIELAAWQCTPQIGVFWCRDSGHTWSRLPSAAAHLLLRHPAAIMSTTTNLPLKTRPARKAVRIMFQPAFLAADRGVTVVKNKHR